MHDARRDATSDITFFGPSALTVVLNERVTSALGHTEDRDLKANALLQKPQISKLILSESTNFLTLTWLNTHLVTWPRTREDQEIWWEDSRELTNRWLL
jgi:hypothetical protein